MHKVVGMGMVLDVAGIAAVVVVVVVVGTPGLRGTGYDAHIVPSSAPSASNHVDAVWHYSPNSTLHLCCSTSSVSMRTVLLGATGI
jgi:hypothetical protein